MMASSADSKFSDSSAADEIVSFLASQPTGRLHKRVKVANYLLYLSTDATGSRREEVRCMDSGTCGSPRYRAQNWSAIFTYFIYFEQDFEDFDTLS